MRGNLSLSGSLSSLLPDFTFSSPNRLMNILLCISNDGNGLVPPFFIFFSRLAGCLGPPFLLSCAPLQYCSNSHFSQMCKGGNIPPFNQEELALVFPSDEHGPFPFFPPLSFLPCLTSPYARRCFPDLDMNPPLHVFLSRFSSLLELPFLNIRLLL